MNLLFFERQKSKNCTIHSLNNAMGAPVITAKEVNSHIDKRIAVVAKYLGMPKTDEVFVRAKERMVDGKTHFSAETVWRAAVGLGRIRKPKPVPGFQGKVLPVMKELRLVILGKGRDGEYHAVGARHGYIFDSLNKGDPVPLNNTNLYKIYSKVFAAFYVY